MKRVVGRMGRKVVGRVVVLVSFGGFWGFGGFGDFGGFGGLGVLSHFFIG